MARKRKPDDDEQSRRFIETARHLEVDEGGEQFEKALRVTINAPTRSESKRPRKKKSD